MDFFAVFATGCIVGIVLAYTNFIGFLAGTLTGIFIQTKGPHIGESLLCMMTTGISTTKTMLKNSSISSRDDDKKE